MYPTTIVGLVLLGVAFLHATSPTARRAAIIRSLSFLTFLTGTLGFVTGVIKSFEAASEDTLGGLGNAVVGGVGESLNNIGLALCVLVLAWIANTIGTARMGAKPSGAELHSPT